MTSSETGSRVEKRELIDIRRLRKFYGDLEAVKGVDLVVREGEVAVLIGPSGCGKSTVLRCINLLEDAQRGTMRFGDRQFDFSGRIAAGDKARHRMDVGMVFQQFHLFPHKTVIENVMTGPVVVKKMPREAARKLAEQMLSKVKLLEKAEGYPRELSGGQAQRVAIARALAMQPKIMLFDEVTSALDPELVEEVLEVVKELAREGTTMVLVTHEMAFAREVADSIYFMDDGLIVESGSPAEVLGNSKSPRLQSFLRRFSRHEAEA
ncbi:MAG: amino acid ABC transporter ATP-binding protein [Brucellaceae bacterium]|nr:amino acid ABC transporter ATP-binding protein [Brucellaceae bacterium]